MNTKIVLSLTMIAVASAGVGYGTYAFFSDTANSTSNIFSAASLDLKLSDANEGPLDAITASIGATNFAPGDSVSGTIDLKSITSLASSSMDLDIKAVTSLTDSAGGSTDMDKYLILTTLNYNGVSILGSITDTDGVAGKSLADFKASSIKDLAAPAATGTPLAMTVQFSTAATNALQGDSVDLTLSFFLSQTGETDLA
jgi:predicted ribosomally synthesized peptide with SipW-like signal peptide